MNHSRLTAATLMLFAILILCTCETQPPLRDTARSVGAIDRNVAGRVKAGVDTNARPASLGEKSRAAQPEPEATMKLSLPLERSGDKPQTAVERAD